MGLPNPPRNNGSQLKNSQKVARHLLALFPQGRQMPGAFFGFSRHFEGGGKEKKTIIFSCLAASTAQIKTPGMTLRATLFPQHREGKHGKVLFLIWVS